MKKIWFVVLGVVAIAVIYLIILSFLSTERKSDVELESFWAFNYDRGVEQCNELLGGKKTESHFNFCMSQIAFQEYNPERCNELIQATSLEINSCINGAVNLFLTSRGGYNVNSIPKNYNVEFVEWCDKISDVVTRDDCIKSYVKVIPLEEICEKNLSDRAKDTCYTELAWEKVDFSICDKVKEETQREFCKTKGA